MEPQVLQGTWEEIAAHANELSNRRGLLLIVPAGDSPAGEGRSLLSPAERITALNVLAERNRNLPLLSPDALERESLYDESF